jgi:hypothetical protein
LKAYHDEFGCYRELPDLAKERRIKMGKLKLVMLTLLMTVSEGPTAPTSTMSARFEKTG